MNAHLAIVGRRSSKPVIAPGGSPADLSELAVPAPGEDPPEAWLFAAINDALREMRVRQRQVSGDATTPLRLGLIVTAEGGTALDVLTGSENLRSLDFTTDADRETVLQDLRALEQAFLSEG